MNEKTYLGMKKNVCFGLSWLLLPLAIVTLCVERSNLTKEERQHLISIFVLEGAYIAVYTFFAILSTIIYAVSGWAQGGLIGLPFEIFFTVIMIIAMVKAFMGKYWNVPVIFPIAGKFVKDLPQDHEQPVEEEKVAEEQSSDEPTVE